MAPFRRFLWRATYRGGLEVQEQAPEPGVAPAVTFADLPAGGLVRLALVEPGSGREAVGLDLASGCFEVRGERLELRVDGRVLTGGRSVALRSAFQYKVAHADRPVAGAASVTVVDAHVLGYAARLPEGRLTLAVGLDARTGRAHVLVDLAGAPGAGPRRGDGLVLLGGRRLDGAWDGGGVFVGGG